MATKEQSDSITFGIQDFEVLSYSYEKPEESIRKDRIGYNIQFLTGGNADKEQFWIDIKATGQYGKKDPIILGEIVTRSIFQVENIKHLFNEDGSVTLPDKLVTTMLSIAFSTTRGALAIKAEGNILAGAILPLVDPKKLLENRQAT